jgi:hypothetical protein
VPAYRYRTEGVPDRAAAACSPLPTTNPIASSWGLVHTTGSPSTTRIPVAPLQSIEGSDRGVWTKGAKPGDNAPDYILPSLYYTAPTPQVVSHASNNEIPIPAINPNGVSAPYSATLPNLTNENPAVVQRPRRMGGRLVQAWPRVTQFWPVFGSGSTNAGNSGSN